MKKYNVTIVFNHDPSNEFLNLVPKKINIYILKNSILDRILNKLFLKYSIKKKINQLDDYDIKSVVLTIDSPVRPISYDKMNYDYDARTKMRKLSKDLIYDFKRKKGNLLDWKIVEKIRKMTKKKLIL